jgi:hypothetical protein
MTAKPIVGKGEDPTKGPPLARAQVMKAGDFDILSKSTDSLTNSLTTTDLDSAIYKKKEVNSDTLSIALGQSIATPSNKSSPPG